MVIALAPRADSDIALPSRTALAPVNCTAPSVGRGLVSLDQFGAVQFTGASAVRDGKAMSLSALGAKAITMINGQGQAIAQPSTLSSDGSSFTIARTDATSTPQTGGRGRRP